jgi:beta-lactamase class D
MISAMSAGIMPVEAVSTTERSPGNISGLDTEALDAYIHIRRSLFLLLLFIVMACSPSASPVADTEKLIPEIENYFQGFDGALVLYDLNANRYTRYNAEKCAERLLPASTFKIMNALIALETGAIPDENYPMRWDGTQYDIPTWNQDHTLKTAFRDSVVWYYQAVARRIGKENMQRYIDVVEYGNRDIGGNLDTFWLDGAIKISADEQVELLKQLYQGELPFSQRSIKIVKELMVIETDGTYRLSGKTGSGLMGTLYIGWFVGYAEVDGNVYVFAANLTDSGSQATGSKAKEIVLNILQDQIIPAGKGE